MATERADGSADGQRRIIVGLGNPGRQYADTRHNVGFHVIERLADKHGLKFTRMMNRGLVALGDVAGVKVALVKPQTFMNDSGTCVGPIAKFYKTEPQHVLVIYDDLDIPVSSLRLRRGGGSGGHNGMKSIIKHVGSEDFPRLRVGIGRPPGRMQPMDFVLTPFSRDEWDLVHIALDNAVDGIKRWLNEGIDRAMNVVNASAPATE